MRDSARFLTFMIPGVVVSLVGVPLAVTVLNKSPLVFTVELWTTIIVSGVLASIFAYRTGHVRGIVAGMICLLTVSYTLAYSATADGFGRLGISLILVANLTGLIGSSAIRIFILVGLSGLAIMTPSPLATGLVVASVSIISWLQAKLLSWAGPKLCPPLRRVATGKSFLIAFFVLLASVLVFFALIYYMLWIIDNGSFAITENSKQLGFEIFFYQSVRIMTTGGPAYEALTRWARMTVALELLVSISILIIYLNLVVTHASCCQSTSDSSNIPDSNMEGPQ